MSEFVATWNFKTRIDTSKPGIRAQKSPFVLAEAKNCLGAALAQNHGKKHDTLPGHLTFCVSPFSVKLRGAKLTALNGAKDRPLPDTT